LFDGGFRARLQRKIANKTPLQEIVAWNQMKRADDLTQLFAIVVAFYENGVLRLLQTQSAVTGENNPIFLAGRMD
jgi:hypothetical protein